MDVHLKHPQLMKKDSNILAAEIDQSATERKRIQMMHQCDAGLVICCV